MSLSLQVGKTIIDQVNFVLNRALAEEILVKKYHILKKKKKTKNEALGMVSGTSADTPRCVALTDETMWVL